MSEQGKEVLDGDKKEDWMNAKWRPMMGWMYMLVCTCDFVIFPVLWSLVQTMGHGRIETQWQPITLSGAGLFHMAMGAIIGVAAFGRTQEKLAGANIGGASTTPSFGGSSSGFNSPSSGAPAFGAPSTGFNPAPGNSSSPAPSTAPSFSSTPTPSFGSTTTPAVGKFGKVVPTQDDPPL